MMEAARLQQIDKDYRNHLQAFLNFSVQATRKSGKNKQKPVYDRFNKFYDYEKEVARVKRPRETARFAGIGKLLKRKG